MKHDIETAHRPAFFSILLFYTIIQELEYLVVYL